MSLLVFLFYWVGIPVLVIATAAWLWRRLNSSASRSLIAVACVATLASLLWFAAGAKWLADRKVRALCAKDGGVRVYETVRLPPQRFNQWGQPNFPIPITPFSDLGKGDQYFLNWKPTSIKSGNPSINRNHFELVRRSDQKILAESVSYSRGGGDLPGPWASSSYTCPDKRSAVPLTQQVFVNSNSGVNE